MDSLAFEVEGLPVPQGSLRVYQTPQGPRLTYGRAERLAIWRQMLTLAARQARDEQDRAVLEDGPVLLAVGFTLPRPKVHYSAAGLVKDRFIDLRPTSTPDVDKLARAVLDALTGVLYRDDSQVVELKASKCYGRQPGARVEVLL